MATDATIAARKAKWEAIATAIREASITAAASVYTIDAETLGTLQTLLDDASGDIDDLIALIPE